MATYHECDRCLKNDKPREADGNGIWNADYEITMKHPSIYHDKFSRKHRLCQKCASEVDNIMTAAFTKAVTHKGNWQEIFA